MTTPTIPAGNKKGADTANTTTTTVTKPDNAPSGALVFVPMCSDLNSAQTFTFDGSFAKLYPDVFFQSVANAVVAYKTSGGAESNYTVTVGTTERQVWQCFAVIDHNGIDTAPASNNGSGATATFPALTPTQNGCLAIRILMNDNVATAMPIGHGCCTTLIIPVDPALHRFIFAAYQFRPGRRIVRTAAYHIQRLIPFPAAFMLGFYRHLSQFVQTLVPFLIIRSQHGDFPLIE